jgi:hypothetical protein
MMVDAAGTVEEAECFKCWNRFLVRRLRDPPALMPGLAIEWPCPYCGSLLEFDTSVVAAERLQISEPRRRLANLTRRLFIAKVDAEGRERERKRKVRCNR